MTAHMPCALCGVPALHLTADGLKPGVCDACWNNHADELKREADRAVERSRMLALPAVASGAPKAKPRLLDLFCGAGGSAMGYHRAGFDVVGVDCKPQKRYPFKFIQSDAIGYALSHGWQYDAIHASPPCQVHSQITPDKSKHDDLIPQTRFVLASLGIPYIIENVERARKALCNPVMLCGADFGLKVYRHRLFESNITLYVPEHFPHKDNIPRAGHAVSGKGFVSVTSGGTNLMVAGKQINAWQLEDMKIWQGRTERSCQSKPETYHRYLSPKGFISVSGHFSAGDYVRFAMAIDWMVNDELAQAIPPSYTEYLGRQLMSHLCNEGLPVQRKLFA